VPANGLTLTVKKDDLTPDLRKKIRAVEDPTPIWRAVGTQLVSFTKRAFRDAALRQIAWPAKRDGTASNLIYKGVLLSSIRITKYDRKGVTIGSDRPYAAIHQLGGVIRPKTKKVLSFTIGGKTYFAKEVKIPARPFLPFTPDGRLAEKAVEPVKVIVIVVSSKALGLS
jgi:phage gpG-like protein